jgi:hypothetical protein
MELQKFKYPESWLFKTNTKSQIEKWIFDLQYFVFYRADGGHGELADYFETAIEYKNEEDLRHLSNIFSIPIDHYDRLENERIKIMGYYCFVKKGKRYLHIQPCHNWTYTMGDDDFSACRLIERKIIEENLEDRVPIEYLRHKPNAITKEVYGEYFK